MLSQNDIANFQAIYLKRFGKEITKEEAYAKGVKIITLMKNIYKPIPKDFKLNN